MNEIGPRGRAFLDNYTALLKANPDAANIDVVQVLNDATLRSRLLAAVTNKAVLGYWNRYDTLPWEEQRDLSDYAAHLIFRAQQDEEPPLR